MVDHGDTGQCLVGIHTNDHLNAALRTGSHDLHGVTAGGHLIHAVQRTVGSGGSNSSVAQLHGSELSTLGGNGCQRLIGLFHIDSVDLVMGDHIDHAQQGGDHQSDDRQSAGDFQNKLTGDLHYFAASFFSFFTAP